MKKSLFWKGEGNKRISFYIPFYYRELDNVIYLSEVSLGSILVFNVTDWLSIFIRIIHKGVLFKNAQRYLIK